MWDSKRNRSKFCSENFSFTLPIINHQFSAAGTTWQPLKFVFIHGLFNEALSGTPTVLADRFRGYAFPQYSPAT
jgi:hypothetical protein